MRVMKYKEFEENIIKKSERIKAGINDINGFVYGYKIVTKDGFISYHMNNKKPSMINENSFKEAESMWNKIRKGYNFVIAVGKEDLIFYSVKKFNEHLESLCSNRDKGK